MSNRLTRWLALLLIVIPSLALGQAERIKVSVEVTGEKRALVGEIKNLMTLELQGELVTNIKALLSIEQQKKHADLTESRIRRLHQQAPAEIAAALEPFGYYSPQIDSELIRSNGQWLAKYQVAVGNQTLISVLNVRVDGEGQHDADIAKLAAALPLVPNRPFFHDRYESAKSELLRKTLQRGYLDAHFSTHQVRVSRAGGTAEIDLVLDTGPRYYFGAVHFNDTVLDNAFLQRYVDFGPGDVYSPETLLDLQGTLYDTDYFSRVELRADRASAEDRHVPIEVNLAPRERYRYSIGAGYSTDDGPRGSLGFTDRRINRRGDRFKSQLRIASDTKSFTNTYQIPIRDPRTDHFDINASWTDETDNDRADETYILGISQTISPWEDYLRTLYLNYQYDKFKILDQPKDETTFLIPGVILSHVSTADRRFAWRGYRWSADLHGANEGLVSDHSFIQLILAAKVIFKLGPSGRLLLRGEAGATQFGDVENLPPSLRFFAGGDQSVRGYEYESLSPENQGGSQMLVGSAEYEWRFGGNWGLAAFTDAGNAMDSWNTPLKKSAGIGVRWYSPIGPIRFDLAQSISDPELDWRIHLVIGPDL